MNLLASNSKNELSLGFKYLLVKFPITIKAGSTIFHLTCELFNKNNQFESFKVYPDKDPFKFIIIEGNRPMLRSKGLKKKAIKWTVKGEIKYQSNLNQAIKQIEEYLEPKPAKNKPFYLPMDTTFGKSTPEWKKRKEVGPTLGDRQTQ